MDSWIIFGYSQIFLSGISSLVLDVSIWGNVAVNVSVEVAGDAGMDGVSDKMHGPRRSGMWLKGGIGTEICALDPF